MTAADITATVRNLPEATALPLTLTRATVTADHFMRRSNPREAMPPLAIVRAAVEGGR